ncbi:hypothetical protein [Ralstonia mannitolilytica]|uniref:hypothetical protein n=1 Tax=Ralstonia mannitolilytica TaxID=105219 RepID=UPI001C98C8F5|nr:hypothetical protein [Ralstonia mannitolilytica]MBY4717511.1 hypothetical protein [Ralstonia mannitolilytica]
MNVYITGLTKCKKNFIDEIKAGACVLPDYEFMKNPSYIELLDLVKLYGYDVELTKDEDEGQAIFRVIVKEEEKEIFHILFTDFNFMFKKAAQNIRAYAATKLANKFEKFLAIKPEVKRRTKI